MLALHIRLRLVLVVMEVLLVKTKALTVAVLYFLLLLLLGVAAAVLALMQRLPADRVVAHLIRPQMVLLELLTKGMRVETPVPCKVEVVEAVHLLLVQMALPVVEVLEVRVLRQLLLALP